MPKRATDIDELVGRNIRVLRLNHGMSQTKLAKALGLTFQQVQKYEIGRNRVGAGRLFAVAGLFGVPVSAFFEGAEHPAGNGDGQSPVALLSEPYALRLVQAFCALENTALRRSVVELVEVMGAVALSGQRQELTARNFDNALKREI
jgi:transcriptional regulator with XRE-family HTH domain